MEMQRTRWRSFLGIDTCHTALPSWPSAPTQLRDTSNGISQPLSASGARRTTQHGLQTTIQAISRSDHSCPIELVVALLESSDALPVVSEVDTLRSSPPSWLNVEHVAENFRCEISMEMECRRPCNEQ